MRHFAWPPTGCCSSCSSHGCRRDVGSDRHSSGKRHRQVLRHRPPTAKWLRTTLECAWSRRATCGRLDGVRGIRALSARSPQTTQSALRPEPTPTSTLLSPALFEPFCTIRMRMIWHMGWRAYVHREHAGPCKACLGGCKARMHGSRLAFWTHAYRTCSGHLHSARGHVEVASTIHVSNICTKSRWFPSYLTHTDTA